MALPKLSNARATHECSKISRFNRDYIMVIGGLGPTGNNVLVVEYYDLKTRPSSWETISGKSLFCFTLIVDLLNNNKLLQIKSDQTFIRYC